MSKYSVGLVSISLLAMMLSSAVADNVVVPYIFSPKSPARASEINANFTSIKDYSNEMNSKLNLSGAVKLATLPSYHFVRSDMGAGGIANKVVSSFTVDLPGPGVLLADVRLGVYSRCFNSGSILYPGKTCFNATAYLDIAGVRQSITEGVSTTVDQLGDWKRDDYRTDFPVYCNFYSGGEKAVLIGIDITCSTSGVNNFCYADYPGHQNPPYVDVYNGKIILYYFPKSL